MKKLRKPMLKSIISFVLAIALVMGAVPLPNMGGLLPDLTIKANAAEYTANPTTKDELVPSALSGSVSEAHVVKYANKDWYVIGYDGVGLASQSGTMTLFLKGTLGSRAFSDNGSNVYADSSIHSYLESYLAETANFTSDESAAVVARTLSGGGSTGNSFSGHVSGGSVDANLWLLSAAEARKLPQNIIKSGGDGYGWWLRSPGNNSDRANYMPVSPSDMDDYPKESGDSVYGSKHIRPAMLLNLDSVIYSSETNTLIAQEAEAHDITVSVNNDQGSVDAPSRADKGETVRFTITPAVGYAVDTVKFNDTSLSPVNDVYSFTMPNVDVTISVTFAQIYRVEDHIEREGDTYTIKTAKGWEVFCDCVKSDTYNGFGGKTVKLGLDITDGVTVSAGILGKPFYGTFDGDGHTLAVALNSTEEWVAPFSVFSGSIKNLTVTGTVEGSNYAGGLTGLTYGGSIENVTVNADISGSSKIGGITGYCNFGSLLVKNTVFNGSLQCDGDVCGLIGWASENVGWNQAITIENCLFNGSYTCDGEFHPITIRNSNSAFAYTDNGAYYTVAPKLSSENYIICAGTHVSTITANSKFEITTEPTFSFDSVNYYAEGTSISLRGTESIESVVINNGAVEVTHNQNGTYSFTMPDCNVTVADKLTQMISFESATQTKTYGDEDFTVTATHSVGDGEVSYAVTEGTDVAEVNSSTGAVTIKKAGTAIITATAAAKDNFAKATAQYTLTVNPKSITVPTAISGLKWTGDEQTGVTDGTGYTVTNGKATDVGSYTATAVLMDKDNTKWNNGSTDDQSIAWSIAKADGPAAPTGLTGTAPTTDGGSDGKISGVDSTMEHSNKSSFASATDCSGTEVTGLSEGTYYVRVKETETHEAGVYATVSVPAYSDNSAKVKKAPIPKTNLVYNGSSQALVEPGEEENGTMYYAVTATDTAPAESLYTTSIPTATDAGTYYVWYKVKGDNNHNDVAAQSITATIKCRVSFDANGGSETMANVGVEKDTLYTLPACTFTAPDGKAFDKWQIGDDTENLISVGDKITITDNTVIKAIYKKTTAVINTISKVDKDGNQIDGNIEGTGNYPIGSEVTFTAPKVEGYNFVGWYKHSDASPHYTGEKLGSANTYTFTATEDADYTAVYEARGKASITVNGGSDFTVNSSTKSSQVTADYTLGSTVTVSVTSDDFAYWANSYGMVLSREKTYSFTVTGADTVTAVFDTVIENKATVIFESAYGQVMARDQLAENETMSIPSVPTLNGYNAIGWDMDGDGSYDAEKDTLATAIAKGLAAEDKTVTIKPIYQLKEDKYNISVTNGSGAGQYNQNEVVTVTANVPEAGQKFSHWKDSGDKILSYDTTYKFFAEKDMSITAVYVADTVVVEAKGTTEIINMYKDTTNNKLTFVSMSTVPEGCTINKAGVIATNNATVGTSGDGFTASTASFVRGNAWDGSAYRFTWTKSNVGSDDTWYVRAYLVYTDASGNSHTIYGDMVSQTY